MYYERIKPEIYAPLASRFNPPKKFSTDTWVKLAKEAGMKYVVLTTRHHEGFCLFDSKCSDFSSVKTASGRDFVAEFVNSCHKYGMKIGFYYSLLDWRFPEYHKGPKNDPDGFNKVVDQVHYQVRELMTNYGKIDYAFFDGEWIPGVEMKRTMDKLDESPDIAKWWRSHDLVNMMRELQPEIIINDRTGLSEDVATPEQNTTPVSGKLWESCMTLNNSWGYFKHDNNWKTVQQLIINLVSCTANGGNYLLNIGPKPDGSVPAESVKSLHEIGEWMQKNSASIYGMGPVALPANFMGWFTGSGNKVYFHAFYWPGDTVIIIGVKTKVDSIKLLKTGKPVKFTQNNGIITIAGLPANPPDKYDTVFELDLAGKPEPYDYTFQPY
jgi:alpha-L-fucosidase